MKYGLPYKGSKNKLAERIVELFPKAENFYDLFCGGGAITHRALITNKFKNFYMNDIEVGLADFFKRAVSGEFKNESRWISRDDFFTSKDEDLYVKLCWSFGNNCRDYMYSKEIESLKKAWHYAIFFDDFELMKNFGVDLSEIKNICEKRKKYLKSKEIIRNKTKERCDLESLESLERLQSLQSLLNLLRLQRLQRLQSLERLQTSSIDYRDVKIKENSVIYCDIPYIDTSKYNSDFNHNEFYEWALNQKNIFISSYWMPESDFVCVAEFKHTSSLSASSTNEVVEKIFVPKTSEKIIYHNKSIFELY